LIDKSYPQFYTILNDQLSTGYPHVIHRLSTSRTVVIHKLSTGHNPLALPQIWINSNGSWHRICAPHRHIPIKVGHLIAVVILYYIMLC